MGVFSRLNDIVNSNINSMLDRAEDPEKIVRLIIQEMEDTLVEVRTNAARAIADKKEMLRRIGDLEGSQNDWQAKAELAITKDREDLAKGALLAKKRSQDGAEAVRQQLVIAEEALAKANEDMARLQEKLAEAKAKQKTFEIRRNSATGRRRMRTQLASGRIEDALDRYAQVERKLDEIEGEVEAFDLGRDRRSLHEQFAELEAEGAIEEELARIRAKLAKSAKSAN